MSKLLRTSDKIKIKIDGIIIEISPLSKRDKMAIQGSMIKAANGDIDAAMEAVSEAIKRSLKGLEGVTYDNEEGIEVAYKLEFDANGHVSEECIDDLLNLPESQKLNGICSGLISGPPKGVILNEKGEPMEGVSIILKKKAKANKPGKSKSIAS